VQTRANNHLFSTIITIQPLTPKKVNHNLLLLDLNHSACSISHQTHISPNTICNIHKKYHPNLFIILTMLSTTLPVPLLLENYHIWVPMDASVCRPLVAGVMNGDLFCQCPYDITLWCMSTKYLSSAILFLCQGHSVQAFKLYIQTFKLLSFKWWSCWKSPTRSSPASLTWAKGILSYAWSSLELLRNTPSQQLLSIDGMA